MYLEYFSLTEKPFSTSPDPRFVFLSAQHREAIAKTEYAATEKLGLAVIYGDIGTGKTTVSRYLLQKFRDEHKFNAVLHATEIPDRGRHRLGRNVIATGDRHCRKNVVDVVGTA